ncbi:MAG: type II secretion system F family protein, partial [Thermodesulfovibrionia bacterium]|nr:type II secretion system F family protein [Thermodesulfovibrionia bacterium]
MPEQATIHIGAEQKVAPKAVQPVKQNIKSVKPKGLIDQLNGLLAKLSPVKTGDKVSFFRLLATMINAGISIVKALNILTDQTENPAMKEITIELARSIEAGKSFSEAMKSYPKVFSNSQVGMVESGEASGRLNQTLLQIAEETESSAALISKIKGAMIYPVVVIFIMLGAGFAVMTFVMPKIKEMFESLGGELPATTMALINASDFMVSSTMGLPNSLWVVIGLVALYAVFSMWKKTKTGAYLWATAVFHIPVFGKLSRKVALARFCRGLSTMISSGISIIKALEITAASVGNAVYEKRIRQIADDVKQGITMAENMKDDKEHFPSMIVGMIGVAEQTAQIDEITGKLADFYEEEVNDMVKGLSALLEPIIIVVLGGAVAFLVIS